MIEFAAALFAQMDDFGDSSEPPFIVLLLFGLVLLALMVGTAVFVAWLISDTIRRVPPQYRQNIEPEQAWFMLIPIFNVVWNFMLFTRTSRSLRAYFNAQGHEPGDCGESVGLWYCICVVGCAIPCLNYLIAPAALILLLIYLFTITGFKKQIPEGAV